MALLTNDFYQTVRPVVVSNPSGLPSTSPIPVRELTSRTGYFILPEFFKQSPTDFEYLDSATVCLQYSYVATQRFTLTRYDLRPITATYILCIKWREGTAVHRFKLWEATPDWLDTYGEPLPAYERYNGQVIGTTFCLEVWFYNNSPFLMNQVDRRFYTSILSRRSDFSSATDFEAFPLLAELTQEELRNTNASVGGEIGLPMEFTTTQHGDTNLVV